MPVHRRVKAAGLLVLELALWLAAAGSFLAVYVLRFDAPMTAVAPHLLHIGALALMLMSLRLLAAKVGSAALRASVTGVYALCALALLLYYAAMLVALMSWGRVATWGLLKTYALQWRALLDVLAVPAWMAQVALLLAVLLAVWFARTLLRRLTWPSDLAAPLGYVSVLGLLLFAASLTAFRTYEIFEALDVRNAEPLMMSFNPWAGTTATQSNRTEGARALDRSEAEQARNYVAGPVQHPRNVILIVGDALRGERLSLFGNPRRTTPYLDRLAAEGAFAYAQRINAVCAESYCGLMGIARSKFAHQFSSQSLTLQRVLQRHGYRIRLILGGDHTNFYGLADALGPADDYWDGSQSGDYVNDDRSVIEQAAALPAWEGAPNFIQFHLMSSHGLGRRREEFVQFAPFRNYYSKVAFQGEDTEKQAWARNFYDNGLMQFDTVVRELLETLKARGYLDNAIVLITGDHGEFLGEHGRFSHANGVYQPALDVPLLVLRQGYTGPAMDNATPASQVDIAPTVLHELGLVAPRGWVGQPLQLPRQRGFLFYQQGREAGLLDLRQPRQRWKFWKNIHDGSEYAFELGSDPGEANNRIENVESRLRSEWLFELLPVTGAVTGLPGALGDYSTESGVRAVPDSVGADTGTR
jgi:glucan phosphoethanolaminetransferase (alkaline phosphatase superfamily)